MISLRQYLTSIEEPYALTRTLGEIVLLRDADSRGLYCAGNSAVLFRIMHQGRERTLRCYTQPRRNLELIYGDRLLREELFVYTSPDCGEWVDVVIGDWIEGQTLDQRIRFAAAQGDTQMLAQLSEGFDLLALDLLRSPSAHGDLKPENIVVDRLGRLHLIDFDAQFLPCMAGQKPSELGTKSYQHPGRRVEDFDGSIDDYPIALISAALHALSLDCSLLSQYSSCDGLLFTPQNIACDRALEQVLKLFESRGAAGEYRLARLLLWPTLRLQPLEGLLEWITAQKQPSENPEAEIFAQDGLWGFRTPERVTIPPLYDSGFDFSEALAVVRLGATWHFIDPSGRAQLSLEGCQAVKPMRGGRAVIVRDGVRLEIDRRGQEFEI